MLRLKYEYRMVAINRPIRRLLKRELWIEGFLQRGVNAVSGEKLHDFEIICRARGGGGGGGGCICTLPPPCIRVCIKVPDQSNWAVFGNVSSITNRIVFLNRTFKMNYWWHIFPEIPRVISVSCWMVLGHNNIGVLLWELRNSNTNLLWWFPHHLCEVTATCKIGGVEIYCRN